MGRRQSLSWAGSAGCPARLRMRWVLGTLFTALAVLMAPVAAQDAPSKTGQQKVVPRGKRLPGVTPEREAAVLAFVGQHHPELTRLLTYLQTHQPRQYQRAVRELAMTVERLAQIHERDMDRYDRELQIWKTKSQIDLLTAKWQMQPSDALKTQLRTALTAQARAQHELLLTERERLRLRLQKLDAQIGQFDAGLEASVEARLQELTKRPRRGGARQPAAQAKTRKSDE